MNECNGRQLRWPVLCTGRITHVVATPHCHRFGYSGPTYCRVVRLNEELCQAGVPLTILPGSEVQVVDTATYRSDFEAGLYCHLGDSRTFTLQEFPWKEGVSGRRPQLVFGSMGKA